MVSIIVPIYNTEKYLEKCLISIEKQTYQNIEVILVNDGSKDNSERIAVSFVQRDSRFVLFNQSNQGVSVARNHGLKKAHGQYVMFVDSDDWMEPDMIDVLVKNCQKTDADISCCQSDFQIRNDIEFLEMWNQDRAIREFLAHKRINGQLTNKLLKRSIAENVFFNTKIKYGEDALFLWQLLKVCNGICLTNQILYHRTIHDDSASGGGFKPIRMQSHQRKKESANKMKLTYTNVNGYLIPNLTYKSGEQMEQLGKYGFLRRDYLKNHRNSLYQVRLLQDSIGEHLLEVDKAAREREEIIMKQLEEKDPLPDKEKDQMAWVRAANQHRAIAEEIILKELIYV